MVSQEMDLMQILYFVVGLIQQLVQLLLKTLNEYVLTLKKCMGPKMIQMEYFLTLKY